MEIETNTISSARNNSALWQTALVFHGDIHPSLQFINMLTYSLFLQGAYCHSQPFPLFEQHSPAMLFAWLPQYLIYLHSIPVLVFWRTFPTSFVLSRSMLRALWAFLACMRQTNTSWFRSIPPLVVWSTIWSTSDMESKTSINLAIASTVPLWSCSMFS